MRLHCPGCMSALSVDDQSYKEKVLLQCPQCLFVFLARQEDNEPEQEDEQGEATLLASDFSPQSDAREFQWNVPGASITIIEGDLQGVHRKLKQAKMVIGRKGADLVIEDKSVSRKHCELENKDGVWWVRDLESTNGVYLNGKQVQETKLHHLDEIRIGKVRILFAETEALEERLPAKEEEDVTKVDEKSREPEHNLPKGRDFHLEFMSGSKKGRSIKFEKGKIIIGRGDEADLNLDDAGVSRKHAMIEIHSREQVYISDLASQNGIWLNGMRVRNTKLIHGDLIRMGSTVLKFIVQDMSK